ncbi:uncharacterized protein N7477_009289 [Penicillium maclennaniae]|uniref:uncharacterized protein n=1 Tax=Penicillium maclennaniae TaxID=1343394 RepID=UPI002540488F|nr:uncharacterized protein N7477_009289 [Penicillium maclennaniae]KAJ5661673.1 hypothetical protein N7477_009289 [Penicillium maclennaniae]
MASASAAQPVSKEHPSRASSTSKTDAENPAIDVNGTEHPYLKELQKSLRNAVKKLNATAKTDAIIAENPGKSLDELVAEKKLNADQKAQALKKPALQAQVAQIEEQFSHYREFAAQYEERLASQKAALEKIHHEELEAVRANAVADTTEATSRLLRQQLLTLTKFLCAAANSRRAGEESLESRALEGVLFQVYAGNQDAVNSMLKLINGADDKVPSVEGPDLEFTYGDVKQASNKYAPEDTEAVEAPAESAPISDPTMTNAGLTELQDTSVSAAVSASDARAHPDSNAPPSQTLISDAGNKVAENTYDPNGLASSATTDSWVEVPRDLSETETGLQATIANTDTHNATTEDASAGKGHSNGRGRGRGGPRRGDASRGGRGRGERGRENRGRGGRGRGRRGGANGSPAATPAVQE